MLLIYLVIALRYCCRDGGYIGLRRRSLVLVRCLRLRIPDTGAGICEQALLSSCARLAFAGNMIQIILTVGGIVVVSDPDFLRRLKDLLFGVLTIHFGLLSVELAPNSY